MAPIPDGFLSRKQVAELFRVDPQTLSHWVRAGKLEGSLHDGRWVFAADTIRSLLGGDRPVLDWRAVADRSDPRVPTGWTRSRATRSPMAMPMQERARAAPRRRDHGLRPAGHAMRPSSRRS